MARIQWDKVGEHFYETGVKNGVLYPQKVDGTYDTGVAWNGLTSISETPDGAEPTELWADNIKYGVLRSAETFGGTIEAYTYPEEFNACDGSAIPTDGVYLGQQSRTPFGLCYRTEIGSDTMMADSDAGYKLHIVYNATAKPSERQYETINDSPDAITFSWEFDTTPVNVGSGYKPVNTIIIDSTKVDSTKLGDLEDLLYGNQSGEPTLPDPATVISTLS